MITKAEPDHLKVFPPLKAIRKNCLDCSGGASKEVRNCEAMDCRLWAYRFGKRPGTAARKYGGKVVETEGTIPGPLRSIRRYCVDCAGESSHYARFCPCDGVHSTRCHVWPYRFGRRPGTVAERSGRNWITPGALPPPTVMLEECGKAVEVDPPESLHLQKKDTTEAIPAHDGVNRCSESSWPVGGGKA